MARLFTRWSNSALGHRTRQVGSDDSPGFAPGEHAAAMADPARDRLAALRARTGDGPAFAAARSATVCSAPRCVPSPTRPSSISAPCATTSPASRS
ncbi:hypothetical protein [Streptomyces ochraceiscleroticus]|uniref:Uncharacterized protein n=1 Tax=Streptomyces ochraceiscleroticus TaxID=47761 RepID=A0ABW1MHR5_9ACTN|nr:hypothetical protein [Streptomyces ochraceiscleroticus]